jgi:cytochrome c553
MRFRKIILTLLVITLFVAAGAAHSNMSKKRNLKVLPQDISDEKLDSVMHSYTKALGVSCDFCHVPDKNDKEVLNYASDENPTKEEARKMIRMTIDINKNYFNTDPKINPAYLTVVTCGTCHKGDAVPQ